MAEENAANITSSEPIDLTLGKNGGVLKEIIRPGITDESPSDGCKVYVHYTGRLLDGTKFDSSVDRNEKFTFDLGKGQVIRPRPNTQVSQVSRVSRVSHVSGLTEHPVIKAWDLGVASMKRGEFCKLTCQPQFAYGEKGSPPAIPPNATLVFEIELFDWEFEDVSEENDKGITRQVLKEGELYDTPKDGAAVEVDIKGIHEDRIFDERSLKFIINEDVENLPKAVENVIKKMKKSERSLLRVKAKYAFGKDGNETLGVPKDVDVKYEIHLKSFEKIKEPWEMNDEEKIEQSEIVKEKGTNFFKAGEYKKATTQYKKIKDLLDHREDSKKTELDEKWNSLKLAAHLNLALCYIKIKEFDDAIQSCDVAIEVDKDSEKAFFRRGEAEFYRRNFETAKSDFTQAKNLNPDNKLASKRIQECTIQIKNLREKEKKTFAGMFDKFAKRDEKEEIRRKHAAKEAKPKTEEKLTEEHAAGDAGNEENKMNADPPAEEPKVNGD